MKAIEHYREATETLPEKYEAWQIFGTGMESVGKDEQPVTLSLRPPEDNEVLLRVDALGLCLSDIKIINLGNDHPRLRGRDLASDPTVLGHECAATVVDVGSQWSDKFRVGERFIVQADIYYKGEGYAFGYAIPGGLAGYCYLDERALDGDEGCYLLPIKDSTGYSQSALSEPWACVEMSYIAEDRCAPLADGRMGIVAGDGDAALRERFPHAELIDTDNVEGAFDDIIVSQPTAAQVQALAPCLAKNGTMFILGAPSEDGEASLDIGAIHYEGKRFLGGGETLEEIRAVNERNDLLPGGTTLIIGGGGPMGQMHVQRAIERPGGPRKVVVTDLVQSRLDHIAARFESLARERGVEFHTLSPESCGSNEAVVEAVRDLSPDGYSDIVILVPSAPFAASWLPFATDGAVVNVFAGVAVGQEAPVRLSDLTRGIKIIGTSGSRIEDMREVLSLVEGGELNTNLSVAAIGGLRAAHEGLVGMRDARFAGKTIIYPQLPDLPLMGLEEISERIPEIADKLGEGGAWTKEAEQALLDLKLGDSA